MDNHFETLLENLSKQIPIKEIKKDYIFLTSVCQPMTEYKGIKICVDYNLPLMSFYLMRKEDYKRTEDKDEKSI